jgi:hypothetical protein
MTHKGSGPHRIVSRDAGCDLFEIGFGAAPEAQLH